MLRIKHDTAGKQLFIIQVISDYMPGTRYALGATYVLTCKFQ